MALNTIKKDTGGDKNRNEKENKTGKSIRNHVEHATKGDPDMRRVCRVVGSKHAKWISANVRSIQTSQGMIRYAKLVASV